MEKHVRKRDFAVFARQALAEKLQRDFGEKIAAENFGWRAGQGRRTDLIARRAALRGVREAAGEILARKKIIKTLVEIIIMLCRLLI